MSLKLIAFVVYSVYIVSLHFHFIFINRSDARVCSHIHRRL